MKQTRDSTDHARSGTNLLSGAETMALMIAAVLAAAATTALAAARIEGYLHQAVTLTLPLATTEHAVSGLRLRAEAHYTSMEARLPAVPAPEAALLAWGEVLSQIGVLAVAGLVFLLAYRLRGEKLFTPGSAWITGACGATLALTGSAGQIVDTVGRTRLAALIEPEQEAGSAYVLFVGTFGFAPLVAGTVLLLVAAAFQFGGRLQKDTEGLV